MQPSYRVKLFGGPLLVPSISVFPYTAFIGVGTTIIEKYGQTFTNVGNVDIARVNLLLRKQGTPHTDNLQLKIFQSDKTTLLGTSKQIVGSTLSLIADVVSFDFSPAISLSDSVLYFLELSRTGSVSNTNFYVIGRNDNNPYAGGTSFRHNGTIWIEDTGVDIIFDVFPKANDVEITTDVKKVITDRGRNNVDGNLKKGVLNLVIDDKDNKYNPLNKSSSLYGQFVLDRIIEVVTIFNSIEYPLFKGLIKTISPNLKTGWSNVTIYDRLYEFLNTKISIGLQSSKTADELIIAILVGMGLTGSDYDVETDDTILENITLDDVGGLDSLEQVVEVGQHHHFIDETGKYIFKNNQWLSDNAPDFTFNHDDSIVDDAIINFEHEGIINRALVHWSTSIAEVQDNLSIFNFGLKESELDNPLMPAGSSSYAQLVGQSIIDLSKNPGNALELFLSQDYPDVFNIKLGDTIHYIDTKNNINDIFSVLGLKYTLTQDKNSVIVLCRKWVEPALVDAFTILEPFVGNIYTSFATNAIGFSQGIKRTSNFNIVSIDFIMKSDMIASENIKAWIFAADGSGFPTGGILATANEIPVSSGPQEATYSFVFPSSERPTLTANVQYAVWVSAPRTTEDSSWEVWSKTGNPYANGIAAERTTIWTSLDPIDFYFKAKIQE